MLNLISNLRIIIEYSPNSNSRNWLCYAIRTFQWTVRSRSRSQGSCRAYRCGACAVSLGKAAPQGKLPQSPKKNFPPQKNFKQMFFLPQNFLKKIFKQNFLEKHFHPQFLWKFFHQIFFCQKTFLLKKIFKKFSTKNVLKIFLSTNS